MYVINRLLRTLQTGWVAASLAWTLLPLSREYLLNQSERRYVHGAPNLRPEGPNIPKGEDARAGLAAPHWLKLSCNDLSPKVSSIGKKPTWRAQNAGRVPGNTARGRLQKAECSTRHACKKIKVDSREVVTQKEGWNK